MSSHLDYKPRILIAEGPWGIEEGVMFGYVTGYDTVTHKCNWKTNWFLKTYTLSTWNMKQEAPFCPHCSEVVPSMIQTLWTLKNMDKIQQDATYHKPWPSSFYIQPQSFYVQQQMMASRPGQVIQYDPKKYKL